MLPTFIYSHCLLVKWLSMKMVTTSAGVCFFTIQFSQFQSFKNFQCTNWWSSNIFIHFDAWLFAELRSLTPAANDNSLADACSRSSLDFCHCLQLQSSSNGCGCPGFYAVFPDQWSNSIEGVSQCPLVFKKRFSLKQAFLHIFLNSPLKVFVARKNVCFHHLNN